MDFFPSRPTFSMNYTDTRGSTFNDVRGDQFNGPFSIINLLVSDSVEIKERIKQEDASRLLDTLSICTDRVNSPVHNQPDLAHETIKSSDKQLSACLQEMSPAQMKSGTESPVPGDTILHRNDSFPAHQAIPHPTSLHQLRWSGKAYVVIAGRKLGIFKTWNETKPLVEGFLGAVHKCHTTFELAFDHYQCWYTEKHAGVIEPNTPIQIAEPHKSLTCAEPQHPSAGESRAPAPEELLRPAKNTKTYYVVAVGRKPGVYDSWEDAKTQTNGVAPSPKKFEDYDDAVNEYREKYNKGQCQVKTHK